MKWTALILIVCVLVVGCAAGYELLNTQLQVTGQGLSIVAAADRAEEFQILQTAMSRNSLEGTVFQSGELSSAENYAFKIYTLRLKNNGLLPAEMIEIQLSPGTGDILYYEEGDEIGLAPGATRDVWVSLLTEDRSGGTARDIYVTYYIWGHPVSMKFTYSGS